MKRTLFPKITIPKTKGEWSNFWYYKKFQTITTFIALVMISFLLADVLNIKEPDLLILYGGSAPMTIEMSDTFQEELSEVLRDINEDNEINFTFVPMVISETITTDQDGIMLSKFTVEIASGDIALYFLDKGMIELFASQGVLTPLEDIAKRIGAANVFKAVPKDGDAEYIYGISLAESKLLKSVGVDSTNMFIAVRALNQRQIGKEKPTIRNQYYLEVLEYILTY